MLPPARKHSRAQAILGAKAVLVVDPRSQTATVHRRNAAPQVFQKQDVLTLDDIIPGVRLPAADLF